MLGGFLWGKHPAADQASPHARGYNEDFAYLFGIPAVHWAAPAAALACSGTLQTSAETAVFSLASFMSLHTEVREMLCFFATCVSDMPERRSAITRCRSTSSRARPICRPPSFALRIPLLTRSTTSDLSNPAITISSSLR